MNKQFLSVLFCALICSTLGHEFLRAHELTHKAKQHHSRSHFRVNDDNEKCSYVCPIPKPSGPDNSDTDVRLIIIKEISVVAVVNITANVAIAVDLQENLAVLFNGNTGVTILIDLKAETGIYLAEGSSDKLWLSTKISFNEYLLNLGSLKNIKDFPGGKPFQIKSCSKEIVIKIGIVLSSLGSDLAERVKVNAQAALSIVVVIGKVLVGTLGGALSIILKKEQATELIIQGGLVKLVTLLKGLVEFSKKIEGGLEALIVADVEFKLGLVLAADSGLEILVALLSQVASKVDLSKVLAPILKSPEALLEAVVSLQQGLYTGLAGVEAVIFNTLQLVSKKISITVFIDVILQVSASGGAVSKERFAQVLSLVISFIQSQDDSFKSSCQKITNFLNDLKDGKLVVGGVDISAILNVVIEAAGKVTLDLVTQILVKLTAVVGLTVALANLYLRLVFFIVSGQGLVYVLNLIPSLNLNIDFSSNKSIIAQLLSSVQVSKIITSILTLDIIGVISKLPVLGDIFNAVGTALKACGKTENDLKSAVKGSNIVGVLFGWIRLGLGLGGGSSPSGGIASQSIIGGGLSISLDITISGGSSGSGGNGGSGGSSGSSGGDANTSGDGSSSGSGSGGSSSGGDSSSGGSGSSGIGGSGSGSGGSGSSGNAGGGSDSGSGGSGSSGSIGGGSGSDGSGSGSGGSAGGSSGSGGSSSGSGGSESSGSIGGGSGSGGSGSGSAGSGSSGIIGGGAAWGGSGSGSGGSGSSGSAGVGSGGGGSGSGGSGSSGSAGGGSGSGGSGSSGSAGGGSAAGGSGSGSGSGSSSGSGGAQGTISGGGSGSSWGGGSWGISGGHEGSGSGSGAGSGSSSGSNKGSWSIGGSGSSSGKGSGSVISSGGGKWGVQYKNKAEKKHD
ncbi:hypothetical protein HHI36_020339 [Cryptolaemus montrouzieri]|uniref:Uncharacterized protein n=1 Tax=Cryptolaemus montrouzieri TaxID=559131 RepID=A0ABD2NB59_9CUCU